MINRKTKRQSPPPYKTTIDCKRTTSDTSSKWSRVLQILSPPNKKRRAFELLGQQDEWPSDDEPDNSSACNSISSKSDTSGHLSIGDQIVPSASMFLRRERSMDDINKQKVLNRRAMYIPDTTSIITDGPADSRHQWTLYCATLQKLRRAALPLSESLHLRKMLIILQQQVDISRTATGFNTMKTTNKEKLIHVQEDEEDDIPLGALLEKSKKPVNNKKININTNSKKMIIPPTSSIKAFYNNRRTTQKQPLYNNGYRGIPINHFHASSFPHYYSYNGAPVQYV